MHGQSDCWGPIKILRCSPYSVQIPYLLTLTMSWILKKSGYLSLLASKSKQDEVEDEAKTTFLGDEVYQSAELHQKHLKALFIWKLLTCVFFVTTILLLLNSLRTQIFASRTPSEFGINSIIIVLCQTPLQSYSTDNTTIELAPPEFTKVRTQFYGGIRYISNGTFYMTTNPNEPRYVGPPTPEIDNAWRDLTESMAHMRIFQLND
jgi:hypothetical protein